MRAAALAAILGLGASTSLYAQQSNSGRDRFFDLGSHQVQRIDPSEQRHLRARLLTASCAACHGTAGRSVGITPELTGIDASHFRTQMRDFALGVRPGTVMNSLARGYTPEEVTIMAEFFAAASPCKCKHPIPRTDFTGGIGMPGGRQP